jgi:hypothetical protein
MKATFLGTIMIAAMMSSASAQVHVVCTHAQIAQCDPRCPALPLSCVRAGPIRPVPPPFRPYSPGHAGLPGPHGGFGIK